MVRSYQWGHGYVIGTGPEIDIAYQSEEPPPGLEELFAATAPWNFTEPEDVIEGVGRGSDLEPTSLFQAQLQRRLETLPPAP